MTVVDNAVYVAGRRHAEPRTLEDTYELLSECSGAGMAWIGLYRPDATEIHSLSGEFSLHELAVEDTVKAHQRPKLERYGRTLFTVLRPARYIDREESVEFGEVHIFTGPDFVITVRHAESPDLKRIRSRLERTPELLARGPEAVLYAIMDQVVDDYAPVVAGLQNDIDEIEDQVFAGDPQVSRRIYELTREVIEFERATAPLVGMLHSLTLGFDKYGTDEELRRKLRDVEDHAVRIIEQVERFRSLLQNILTTSAALVAQRQNEEMRRLSEANFNQSEEVKKISSWAAILFAPTLVGTVYGMNFVHMPELRWIAGYPIALVMMLAVSLTLYVVFKRRDWL